MASEGEKDCTKEGLAQHLDIVNVDGSVFLDFNGRILCLQAAASESYIPLAMLPSVILIKEFHE